MITYNKNKSTKWNVYFISHVDLWWPLLDHARESCLFFCSGKGWHGYPLKNEKHGELRPKTASTLLRVEFHSSNTHTGHHDINLLHDLELQPPLKHQLWHHILSIHDRPHSIQSTVALTETIQVLWSDSTLHPTIPMPQRKSVVEDHPKDTNINVAKQCSYSSKLPDHIVGRGYNTFGVVCFCCRIEFWIKNSTTQTIKYVVPCKDSINKNPYPATWQKRNFQKYQRLVESNEKGNLGRYQVIV